MTDAIDLLTDKEKETLRLIVRGHDAKSCAREQGLSVHTINERLRVSRRKLDVTSSREASRILLEHEAGPDKNLGYEDLGDARSPSHAASDNPSARWWMAGRRPALWITGGFIMSILLAALLLPASPISLVAADTPSRPENSYADAARSAEQWLELVDAGRWEESYAATGAQFRDLNTLEGWSAAARSVHEPLGAVVTRDLIANEFVPAPPNGYQLVKFRSAYANGGQQVETLSLSWEKGSWRVVGITVE